MKIRDGSPLRPRLIQRNFDWKAGGVKERRLGWNFLKFGRRTAMANIWYTEYEPQDAAAAKKKPRPMPAGFHPNTCRRLVGLRFEVNAAGRSYFEGALGRKASGKAVALAAGVELVSARRNRFSAVVLQARDLKKFRRLARPDALTTFRGRPAALLKNPSGEWDILVTE